MRASPAIIVFLLLTPCALAHFGSTTTGNIIAFTEPNEPPLAGENTTINLDIALGALPLTLSYLDLVHGRLMHVFIVGSDMRTFMHIHPEDFPDGLENATSALYKVHAIFPSAGKYVIIVDYTTSGQNFMVFLPVGVQGSGILTQPYFDMETEKQFGAYSVSLQGPEAIESGKETNFTCHVEKNGEPVQDLEMYLGSEIHILAIKSDLSQAVHTHAFVPGHGLHLGTMAQYYSGPNVPVRITFPSPGNYTLFGQFQENGTVVTTYFDVQVAPPNNETQNQYELEQRVNKGYSASRELILIVITVCLAALLLVWLQKRSDERKKKD